MRNSNGMKCLFTSIMLTVLMAVLIPATASGQGRGHGKGHGRSDIWGSSHNNKKCGKFVNCHDARDGRWDGRGRRRNISGDNVWRNRRQWVRNRNLNDNWVRNRRYRSHNRR
jgi:hypothetical protein